MRFLTHLKNGDLKKTNKKDDLGISEQELFRRLEEKGCPVCSVLERHDLKYYSWFSIEKYHEPVFIESLANALGFCARHGVYLDQQNHWGHKSLPFINIRLHEFATGRLWVCLKEKMICNKFLKIVHPVRFAGPIERHRKEPFGSLKR